MRGLLAACIVGWLGSLLPCGASAADPVYEIRTLNAPGVNPTPAEVVSGSLDAKFEPFAGSKPRGRGVFWLKLTPAAQASGASAVASIPGAGLPGAGIPVVVMHAVPQIQAELYAARQGGIVALPQATQLPGFRGGEDTVFAYVDGLNIRQSLYVRISLRGGEFDAVGFSDSTLDRTLARGAEHARMIALVFGALIAVALSALLIWFVLMDRLFILYATLFFLQALYIAYLSGQGFDWPWLSYARPLTSFA